MNYLNLRSLLIFAILGHTSQPVCPHLLTGTAHRSPYSYSWARAAPDLSFKSYSMQILSLKPSAPALNHHSNICALLVQASEFVMNFFQDEASGTLLKKAFLKGNIL